MSTLDSAWVMTAGYDGLAAHNSPAWMSLYLAVCKLLDLALVLPAHVLPQFQMYRWAFVSEGGSEAAAASGAIVSAAAAASVHNHNGDLSADDGVSHEGLQHMHLPQQDFVPYVVRVAKLLLHKVMNCEYMMKIKTWKEMKCNLTVHPKSLNSFRMLLNFAFLPDG